MARYILNVLIGIDQLFTTLLGGFPDETMSSYAYRMAIQRKPFGFMRNLIDSLFFWQPDHCRLAYLDEVKRRQMPPELRGSNSL